MGGWWGPLPEGHNNNRQDILTFTLWVLGLGKTRLDGGLFNEHTYFLLEWVNTPLVQNKNKEVSSLALHRWMERSTLLISNWEILMLCAGTTGWGGGVPIPGIGLISALLKTKKPLWHFSKPSPHVLFWTEHKTVAGLGIAQCDHYSALRMINHYGWSPIRPMTLGFWNVWQIWPWQRWPVFYLSDIEDVNN